MGQFKPMVKMATTEPSIELKLKKGGAVKKADGGAMVSAMPSTMPSATIGAPRGGALSAMAPKKPSLAMRRRAMMAPTMKEGGESKAEHMAEMKKMSKVEKELKSHESKPASKAHKGLKTGGVAKSPKPGNYATGGVVMGQGGYKKGGKVKKMAEGGVPKSGIINTEGQGGIYRNTKMVTDKLDHSPAKTRGVKDGNGGGYATGGVAKSNAGGYKKGGSAKKAYATGGKVDSGRPVAMPQGRKRVPAPVAISQLAGTYKNGGRATPAQARLLKNNATENATAMRQAKAQSNEAYSKYQKKMAEGGVTDREREIFDDMSKGAYDRHYADEMAENEAMGEAILGAPKRALSVAEQEALHRAIKEGTRPNQFGIDLQGLRREMQKRGLSQRDIDNMLRGQGATTDYERNIFGKGDFKDRFQHEYLPWKGDFFSKEPEEVELPIYKGEPPKYQNLRGKGAITQTERSVTVSPAGKKRGGRAC